MDGLCHISELSWNRIKHPSEVVSVGDTIDVYVKDIDTENHKVSLGYKKADDNPWEQLKNNYPIGSTFHAPVVSLTKFGAFVRILPGVDGLVHISEISHDRVEKVSDALKVGDMVDVKLLDVDFDKKRISLSMKALLNIVLYALFNKLFGYTAANSWGNVLDNIICILFAYCTNRAFVFHSKTQGKAMAREFGAFVTCRLGTMLLDTAIMLVLGNLLAAQGAALMDELMQGVLSVVAHWLSPDTAIQMAASYAGTPAGVTDGSAAIAVIGGADGPTAIFVTSRYNAQALWGLAVKVFSNVLVIVLNYVFSKLIIFKNRK